MLYPIRTYRRGKIISQSNMEIIYINPKQVSFARNISKDVFEIKIVEQNTLLIDQEGFDWLIKQ